MEMRHIARVRQLFRSKKSIKDPMADVQICNLKGYTLNPALVNFTIDATEMESDYLTEFTKNPCIRKKGKPTCIAVTKDETDVQAVKG